MFGKLNTNLPNTTSLVTRIFLILMMNLELNIVPNEHAFFSATFQLVPLSFGCENIHQTSIHLQVVNLGLLSSVNLFWNIPSNGPTWIDVHEVVVLLSAFVHK